MRDRSKLKPTLWWVMLALVVFWLLAWWAFALSFVDVR
jgi:hypothetical protein